MEIFFKMYGENPKEVFGDMDGVKGVSVWSEINATSENSHVQDHGSMCMVHWDTEDAGAEDLVRSYLESVGDGTPVIIYKGLGTLWKINDMKRPGTLPRNLEEKLMRAQVNAEADYKSLRKYTYGEPQNLADELQQGDGQSRVILGGGCFWGLQEILDSFEDVETRAVYAGGMAQNPSYAEVCSGRTGHVEAVDVLYDPRKVSFGHLLKVFFESHDSTYDPSQHRPGEPDEGPSYQSVIFYTTDDQRVRTRNFVEFVQTTMVYKLNEGYKRRNPYRKDMPILTRIEPKIHPVWTAEEQHQRHWEEVDVEKCKG
jgi:methionine-S-sulfoxide reductase